MPFASGFIREDTLEVTDDLVGVELRLPWMRSLPWRCIRSVEVTLNGIEVAPSQLTFRMDGCDVNSAPGAVFSQEGYWVVGTSIKVWVPDVRPGPADDIAMRVEVGLLIPYIPGSEGPPDFTAVAMMRRQPMSQLEVK